MTDQMVFDSMFDNQVYGPRKDLTPRDWHVECHDQYLKSVRGWQEATPHRFCIYAGTGSGKTIASAYIAAAMLNADRANHIIIVVPNRSILRKTRKEFARSFGIILPHFQKRKHERGVPRMDQGYIITYSAVMNDPQLHSRLCQANRTLVIFDEIHHLGDNAAWGKGATEAFANAGYILALTGTPYRSDNTRIPFVDYEETEVNGILRFRANYCYTLGRAVADGVCRKPLFCFHKGKARIRLGDPDSTPLEINIDQPRLTLNLANHALRGLVNYGSTDRASLLGQALARCREEKRKVIIFLGGDTEAETLPTADATEFLPVELQSLGYSPDEYEIVTGDDSAAQDKIEAFPTDPKKWIMISINMISEGTDIPPLSAAIFLTSITTKQTTVQRIGRILRLMGDMDPHKDALIFLFAHQCLIELACEIDEEIRSEIDLRKKKREATDTQTPEQRTYRSESIGIGDGALKMVTFHGQSWPADLFEQTEALLKNDRLPSTFLAIALTLLMKAKGNHDRGTTDSQGDGTPGEQRHRCTIPSDCSEPSGDYQ